MNIIECIGLMCRSGVTVQRACYPSRRGSRIDMWKEDSRPGGFHIFGYWTDGSVAGPDNPPSIEVRLPILDNGNYPGAPDTTKFYEWVYKARKDTKLFTIENYMATFAKGGK